MSSSDNKRIITARTAAFVLMPLFFALIILLAFVLAFEQAIGGLSALRLFISNTAIEAGTVQIDGELNMFDEHPNLTESEPETSHSETSEAEISQPETSLPDVQTGDPVIDRHSFAWPYFGSLFAYIDVPQLGIKDINLYWGSTTYTRRYGVVQSTDSFLPGYGRTVLVLGHCSYYFAFLEEIQPGQLVTVRTYYGKYVYRVTSSEIIDSRDKERYDSIIRQDEKEMLVMYTCYPFTGLWTSKRMVVFCDKVSGPVLN